MAERWMRRAGLGLAAAGLCAVGATLAVPAFSAEPPEPTYESADVDGSPGEWDGGDVFATLVSDTPPHDARGTVSLRYDCEAGVLYAYVATAEGYELQTTDPDEAYLRLGSSGKIVSGSSGDDGAAPDFAWVGQSGDTAGGFEASAEVAEGSYALRVHAKVPDDSSDGYETIGARDLELVIDCEVVQGTTTSSTPEETTTTTEEEGTTTTERERVLPATIANTPAAEAIEEAPEFTG